MADKRDAQLGQVLDGQVDDAVHRADAADVEVLEVARHLDRAEPLLDRREVGEVRRVGRQRIRRPKRVARRN